ncbi:MAG: hypothetical protein ACT4OS_12090 [Acidimicrobiales bacterium]
MFPSVSSRPHPALPPAALAGDGHRMAAHLGRVLGVHPDTVRVETVSQRPGDRTVLRYTTVSEAGPSVIFGKIFSDRRRAETLAERMSAWHAAGVANQELPAVCHPVVVVEELHLVLQPAAAGEPLSARLGRCLAPPDSSMVTRAGRDLAGVHIHGPPLPGRRDLSDITGAATRALGAVAAHDGHLAEELAIEIERAEREWQDTDGPEVPSHGSFRADHLFGGSGRTVMIDLDGSARAAPEIDAANFLAYLDWKAVRNPAWEPLSEAAPGWLLEGYQSAGGNLSEHRLDLARRAFRLRIAATRFTKPLGAEWPLVRRLVGVPLPADEPTAQRPPAAAARRPPARSGR